MTKRLYVLVILILINVPLLSRDIDLDSIYLDRNSGVYKEITSLKERLYSRISSLYVDSNVIFAGWSSGDDIIYIKEFPGINIVYRYMRSTRARREIVRFDGCVTSAIFSRNGDTLFIKTLFYNDDAEAESEVITVDIGSGTVIKNRSRFLFLDFTLHPSGNGIVTESSDGSIKHSSNGGERTVIKSYIAGSIKNGSDPVLAYISPDGKKFVLVSGNGGSYRAKVVTQSSEKELNGVSSNSDIKWIDNSRFIYRSGGGGDYSVRVYDIRTGKSGELITGTMNPDINFSDIPGIITCLENQVITVIPRDLRKRIKTGIEGEESYFSPDGRKFTSIYLGKLYVNSLNMVEKYRMEIRRNAGDLLDLYKKASKSESIWLNDYSAEYIDRKIRQYYRFYKMNNQ